MCCSQEWSQSGKVIASSSNRKKVASFHTAHRIWLHNVGNAQSCLCPKPSGRASSDQQILGGLEGITPVSSDMASLSVRKQRDSKTWTHNREGPVSSTFCVVFVTRLSLILFLLVFLHHSSVKHKAFTKYVVKPNHHIKWLRTEIITKTYRNIVWTLVTTYL